LIDKNWFTAETQRADLLFTAKTQSPQRYFFRRDFPGWEIRTASVGPLNAKLKIIFLCALCAFAVNKKSELCVSAVR
jgi:hypothetical protein